MQQGFNVVRVTTDKAMMSIKHQFREGATDVAYMFVGNLSHGSGENNLDSIMDELKKSKRERNSAKLDLNFTIFKPKNVQLIYGVVEFEDLEQLEIVRRIVEKSSREAGKSLWTTYEKHL